MYIYTFNNINTNNIRRYHNIIKPVDNNVYNDNNVVI